MKDNDFFCSLSCSVRGPLWILANRNCNLSLDSREQPRPLTLSAIKVKGATLFNGDNLEALATTLPLDIG